MSVKRPKIKGKKKHSNKVTSKKASKYKIEDGKLVKARSCPRCGPGIFLAVSSGRSYCGRCHLTEFDKKEVDLKLKDKE
jgi:ubiquitin-small subunit ribosomal protein S27Ae